MTRLAILGTGYVGLTTGACLSHLGHDVVCGDVDAEKIATLSRGHVPILEHRLDELVRRGIHRNRLRFVLGAAEAVADCEIAFLCVPTPQGEDGSADLSYVEAVAAEIRTALPHGAIVVNKSTVPVGSSKIVERVLARPDVRVVSNPEFLREGSAVADFLKPDRIVVGADDRVAAARVGALYDSLRAPVIVTDAASAETIKYAANAYLATKLSFVNAIAAVCEGVGADIEDVVAGMGYDRRIGSEFLRPGPGWGGSCFGKDCRALLKIAGDGGYTFDLLSSAVHVNNEQFDRIVDKIRTSAGGTLRGARVAVWGLTFKARTDDLRDSPSIAIIERLLAAGAAVHAFDPTVTEVRSPIPDATVIHADPYAATEGADVLTVLTEWEEFRWFEPRKVAEAMVGRGVVDGRNLLDRDDWQANGFEHVAVGR